MSTTRIERRAVPSVVPPSLQHFPPSLVRVLLGRGVSDAKEIEHRLSHLIAPSSMGGMGEACELLIEHFKAPKKILIVGDFDADGATGTAVLVRGLKTLGAYSVNFRVPNRQTHGYGLSPNLIAEIPRNDADLIITVDNGIASNAGVDLAKTHGFKVLITDHHLPGLVLPQADAIVNPNLDQDSFPSKAIAGVGVAFYLLLALRARLRERGDYLNQIEPDLNFLLDLVALGTVADMVPLDFNNRCLVEAGLRRMRAGKACAGINALLRVGGRDYQRITAVDLGFVLGPRINAAGRLEDMRLGIECLLTDDNTIAFEFAQTLDSINTERRALQNEMTIDAQALVDDVQQDSSKLPVGLVVAQSHWHPGVVGLVANKLKDQFHRPVVALAPSNEENDEWRGSARSIKGFNIRDALAEIDAKFPDVLIRFGGHAMAAGLSLHVNQIEVFKQAFDQVARRQLGDHLDATVVLSDGEIAGREASFQLAEQLRDLAPWGQGFPEPIFDNIFRIESKRLMGDKHLRFQLRFEPCDTPIEAVFFGGALVDVPAKKFRAAWQLVIDEWRGEKRLRALIRHLQPI